MLPVGYLVNKPDGLYGVRGTYYDYVLAGNGVFIEAENSFMAARALVSPAAVRGLAPKKPEVILKHGKVPNHCFDLILDAMIADCNRELYAAITWQGNHYGLYIPEQKQEPACCEYKCGDNVVIDLHSHGIMSAGFSNTDNNDDQGMRIYGVTGKLDARPQIKLRVGVYGYYSDIKYTNVFENINGVTPASDTFEEDMEHELQTEEA
jgi:PRTRC genetic system protein A